MAWSSKSSPDKGWDEPLLTGLRRRMAQPQRHRLLQGYLMAPAPRDFSPLSGEAYLDDRRPLLIARLEARQHASRHQGARAEG